MMTFEAGSGCDDNLTADRDFIDTCETIALLMMENNIEPIDLKVFMDSYLYQEMHTRFIQQENDDKYPIQVKCKQCNSFLDLTKETCVYCGAAININNLQTELNMCKLLYPSWEFIRENERKIHFEHYIRVEKDGKTWIAERLTSNKGLYRRF